MWIIYTILYLLVGGIVSGFFEDERQRYNERSVIGFSRFFYVMAWPAMILTLILFWVVVVFVGLPWQGYLWLVAKAEALGKHMGDKKIIP